MSAAGVELVLVKQMHPDVLDESDQAALRDALLAQLDGLNEQHRKRWRRFIAWMFRAEFGEYLTWTMLRQRSGPFHRRHMKIESAFFDSQERFDDETQFRNWLKVGAGHVDWFPGPKGGIVPIPKSISYLKLGEDEMQELHVAMMRFLRTPHAQKTMWPAQKNPAIREASVEAIMQEFNE